jgi:hypothetical protein
MRVACHAASRRVALKPKSNAYERRHRRPRGQYALELRGTEPRKTIRVASPGEIQEVETAHRLGLLEDAELQGMGVRIY